MFKLYKNKKGQKLYPVCSWEANQHKLYNAHDRVMNHIWDLEHEEIEKNVSIEALDNAYEQQEEIEHLLEIFSDVVVNGIVYATWEDRNMIRDYIAAYDIRHDMAWA